MKTEKNCARHNNGAGAILPAEAFYIHKNHQGKPTLGGYCKECCKKAAMDYHRQNPEQANAAIRKWRRANPDKANYHYESQRQWRKDDAKKNPDKYLARHRKHKLKRYYGLTEAEYDVMLAEQGGHCALCPATKSLSGKSLHVDHDHETGEIRGLLCERCNSCLERIEIAGWVDSAISYLKYHKDKPNKRYADRERCEKRKQSMLASRSKPEIPPAIPSPDEPDTISLAIQEST